MSIFFDKKLQSPVSAGNRVYLDIEWHKVHPLLALVVDDERKGGLVAIYDHLKEDVVDVDAEVRYGVRVTSISWHPSEPLLGIGYDTGEVLVWNHSESECFEGVKNHVGTIVVLGWSNCGSCLVSADSLGSLVAWISNTEGHIQPQASHDFKDVVSQVVFRRIAANTVKLDTTERSLGRVTDWRPKTGRRTAGGTNVSTASSSSGVSFGWACYVGLLNGAIFYIRDNGSSEEVLTSGSSVKFLLYHQVRDVLIVMTDAAILGQFEADTKGGLTEINKVKVSGRGDINISWAGVGTLAIVSEDLSVRLMDVDTGDNYVVEPKGPLPFASDEYICSVDYSEKSGHLCCNTNKGKLVIWKEIGGKELNFREEDRWEWCSTSPVSQTTRLVKWCPGLPNFLALNAVRDIFVLRQQVISATYNEKVSIVQVLATQLSVSLVEQKSKFELDTEIQVKGFTNSTEHICVWSGNQLEIYEFGAGVASNSKFVGTFKEKSDTIHLYEKNIFVLESHQIQMKSFQGTIKQTLTFTSDEGLPITLSGMGEYITSATSFGCVKIWHVGGREAKIHSPSKNVASLIQNFGEIIQARNSYDGSKIAITVARKSLVPDSRFFVWEVGTDNLLTMSFPGHFISKICWEAEDSKYLALELAIIPAELAILQDDGNEFQESSGDSSNSTNIELSSNPYLIKRAEKKIKESSHQKYLKVFESAEALSLKELQQLLNEADNPRRKQRFQAPSTTSTIPPWELHARSHARDQEDESIKYNPRPLSKTIRNTNNNLIDDDIDEGFGEPAPEKKSSNIYKKPMPQTKRRFRTTITTSSQDDGQVAESENSKTEEQQMATPSKKSSILELQTNKKVLDIAGFTRKSENVETVEPTEPLANQIVTLFISQSDGILKHENIRKAEESEVLLGLDVPYWYSLSRTKKGRDDDAKSPNVTEQLYVNIERKAIADFKGVDDELVHDGRQQKEVKQALLNYVFHHMRGDVDKALTAMESIQSLEIWRNMARLCISSKRVDVASICLARMNNVGACRAIRLSLQREDELDAQVAIVALQLDMLEEAEKHCRRCGRWDLLLEILISCEQWEKAIEVCENHYRIQLKTTYYVYAKYLEDEGSLDEAIKMYEKSGTHRTEVVRMLQHHIDKLEAYVLRKKEKEIYKWWAQYNESIGNIESAQAFYELAEDFYSLCRLLCFSDQVDRARLIAEKSRDKAASYHIAGEYYKAGNPDDAVLFYQRAEAYGPAMRICMENEMDEMLYNLSHLALPPDQLEAAKYFETRDPPDYEKSIRLYHKGGFSSKAMDIAYTTQQFGALQDVVRELLESSERKDPEMLSRCAEFFVANQQFSKALDIFATAKKYAEAMDVCVRYKIPIDEEMGERLTVPKGDDTIDAAERRRLLEKLAECCMVQGSYHLAAKKFTQAGDKEKAMKVLLKSGDTERIIHYANVSRHRDIYLMAANYLQTTDWQRSPKLIEKIIIFYTKAKMPESIVSFYEAWATTSYDVDHDYEQSLEHLKKAEEVLRELKDQETAGGVAKSFQQRLIKVQAKIQNVSTFLNFKRSLKRSPAEAIQKLRSFVKDPTLDGSVSRGDIYALIIEYYVTEGEYEAAVDTLVEMKQNVARKPGLYIRKETLEALNNALGKQSFQIKMESNETNSVYGGRRRRSSPELGNHDDDENVIYTGEGDEEVEEEIEEDEDEEVVEGDEGEEEVEYVEVDEGVDEGGDDQASDKAYHYYQQQLNQQSSRIK